MHPSRITVVLVRPSRPANVAAACRALKNMGLSSLRIVGPPQGLQTEAVRALAYGAWDVLDGASTPASLEDAVSDCTLVAGTSGKGEAARPARAFAAEAAALSRGGRIAVVFGPEATGLTTAELALCHVRVRIPSDPAQPSLNLAQAVLVLAYELSLAAHTGPEAAPPASPPSAGELEAVLDHLRSGLLGIGFLNPANPEAVLAELRGLLWRAAPSARELTLLHGMARQLGWAAAEIARLRTLLDNPQARGAP